MKKHIPLILRVVVALILIQTLRFKFTAHPDSVYIFTKVGLEPYGRISIGILELIAGLMLLTRKTAWIGALLTMAIIGGAIFIHLTVLGIQVNNDEGILFTTAVTTFTLSIIIFYLYKKDVPFFNKTH